MFLNGKIVKKIKTVWMPENGRNKLLDCHFGLFVLHQDSDEVHLIESGICLTHVNGGVTRADIQILRCSHAGLNRGPYGY